MIGERQFQVTENGDVEAIHVFPTFGDNDFTYELLRALDSELRNAIFREDYIAYVGLQELYKLASAATRCQ